MSNETQYPKCHMEYCADCRIPCTYVFKSGAWGTYMARGCTSCQKTTQTPTDLAHRAGALGFINDIAVQTGVDDLMIRTILSAALWCDQFRDSTNAGDSEGIAFSVDLNAFGQDATPDLAQKRIKHVSNLWIHSGNSFYAQPDKRFKEGHRKIATSTWERLWIWTGDEYSLGPDDKPDGLICITKLVVSRHFLDSMIGNFSVQDSSRIIFVDDAYHTEGITEKL